MANSMSVERQQGRDYQRDLFDEALLKALRHGAPGGATSIVARTVYFTGNANLGSNPLTRTFGGSGASGISLVQ